jgi:Raf kinase inhibitor-like YbhB/YbcL family protein
MKKNIIRGIISGSLIFLISCNNSGKPDNQTEGSNLPALKLSSPAFSDGAMIPAKYSCAGENISPPLKWDKGPPGTKSFALITDDPDAPGGTWVHWVIYNIGPENTELAEKVPTSGDLGNGARQGITSFKNTGYGGPCPPSGTHRYFFRLYALDAQVQPAGAAGSNELLKAMQGHILAQGQLMGRYQKK